MAARGGTEPRTKVVARDKDFTLYVKNRGAFTVLAPTGRSSETLLGLVAQDYLQKPGFLAVDLSRLDAVTLPLVRAVCEYAAGLEPRAGRVVLLNPPDKIRALVRLVDREGRVVTAVSEQDLEGGVEGVDERLRRAGERVELVRQMLSSNPCWQLSDADARWLCPFCVAVRPDVRLTVGGHPTSAAVAAIARHLSEECSTYSHGATDGWPFEVLERVIRQLNAVRAAPEGPEPRKAPPAPAESDSRGTRRRRLLPVSAPPLPGCDAGIYYRPAEPPSGDFYGFVRLAGGAVAVLVGDVSGAGVDLGVLMGMARKVLCLRLGEIGDPGEALARGNDDLCEELEQESYVSAAVAIVEGGGRELRLARAGHVAPFLVRAGGPASVTRLETPGPLLGLVPTASFDQEIEVSRHELRPGDLLLLHTVGVEELRGRSGEKFGADRIGALLRAHVGADPALALGGLMLEAEQFAAGGPRREDVTAVCVKVR